MKPEISEEIISGWRREFVLELAKKLRDDNDEEAMKQIADAVERGMWDDKLHFYLAARKKAHSEREDAFKAFTLDLVDRYEKEIEKLKERVKKLGFNNDYVEEVEDKNWNLGQEIQSLKAMIVECKPYVEYALKYSTAISQKTAEQWLTKTENIRVD